MSQHMFNTCRLLEDEKREEIISVTMGWDKPLQYFFMVIDGDDEEPLWSNLDQPEPFQKDLELYKEVLQKFNLKISVPQQMFDEVLADKEINAGNKLVSHKIEYGNYVRNLLMDQ